MKRLELTGMRFGSLLVTKSNGVNKGKACWECVCDCGLIAVLTSSALNSGNTKSCGCRVNDHKTTHGKSYTSTYNIWNGMLARCKNKNDKSFARYGAKWITVCDRWLKFENFHKDMGDHEKGLQLDRIDNKKGYSPDNCRWVSPKSNARNRSDNKLDVNTVSYIKTILKYKLGSQKDLANLLNVSQQTISDIKAGRSWSDINTMPI